MKPQSLTARPLVLILATVLISFGMQQITAIAQFEPLRTPVQAEIKTNFEYETTFQHIRAVRAVAFSPNGALLATAEGPPPPNTGFPDLNVWNTVTHKRVLRISSLLHRRSITAVEFSPDGRFLASASVDGNIGAWDPRTGQMLWYIENAHEGGVQSLAFSRNSRLLVTGGRDNTVRLWNVERQKLLNTLEGHTDWVLEVAISRDNVIASASRDQTIRLWNPRGKYQGSLQGHTDSVTSVGFAPTGEIVSASRDMTIRSWNPQTRAPLHIFKGHTDHVHQATVQTSSFVHAYYSTITGYREDEIRTGIIASPSADGTVRLWSLARWWGELQVLMEHANVVRIAAFSPNALMLASGDESGNVILWRDTHPDRPTNRDVNPPQGFTPPKLTVPHSIELVTDNPVVERGDTYRPVFVVRNADGEPLEGVEVKLSLGQWELERVRTTEIPIPPELTFHGRIALLRDDDPSPRREEVNVTGWRVKSDPSASMATTDSKGEVVFSRRLVSEGKKYGVSATVLQSGREFLTTSFSTASAPNREYITPREDVRGIENWATFYRVSGGWRVIDPRQIDPPSYRVSVIPRMQFSCGVDLIDTSVGVRALDKYPGAPGLTSPDIELRHGWEIPLLDFQYSEVEWIDPKWTPADTVAAESRDILILTVEFLNGDDTLHKFVEEAASEWSKHANVKFDFFSSEDASRPSDIRIKFHSDDTKERGGDSRIGRDHFVRTFFYQNRKNPKKIARRFGVSEGFAKKFAKNWGKFSFREGGKVLADLLIPHLVPTMNYYNLAKFIEESERHAKIISDLEEAGMEVDDEKRTRFNARGLVLHEFGHALGLAHEHVNPDWVNDENFEWNEEVIKKEKYGKYSPEEQQKRFDANFGAVSKTHTLFTTFDKDSVMLYPIKPGWNTLNRETFNSNELSDTDKFHIGSDQFYGAPKPVIKLVGSVNVHGEIYEDARGFGRKLVGGEKWESKDVSESESILAFVGSGNSPVKIEIDMHEDSNRTFALYLGAVRATSGDSPPTGISIAKGAGFLNFDVDARAKGEFYGFTPCDRMTFELNYRGESVTERDTFTTKAENTGGDIQGFLEKAGEIVTGVLVAVTAPIHAPFTGFGLSSPHRYEVPASVVEAACELDKDISLRLSPDDLIPVYDGAADYAEVTLALAATHFKPIEGEIFKLASDPVAAAPSVALTVPDPTIPQITTLLPNYPNPFNPETWIPYHLATPADVTLTIYAMDGKVVRHLDLGHQDAGFYRDRVRAAYWDGRNAVGERVASGIYFYTLKAGDFFATQKMLILK